MFLMCRITESKRRHGQEQNELNKQRITEKELTNLNQKIVSFWRFEEIEFRRSKISVNFWPLPKAFFF